MIVKFFLLANLLHRGVLYYKDHMSEPRTNYLIASLLSDKISTAKISFTSTSSSCC